MSASKAEGWRRTGWSDSPNQFVREVQAVMDGCDCPNEAIYEFGSEEPVHVFTHHEHSCPLAGEPPVSQEDLDYVRRSILGE